MRDEGDEPRGPLLARLLVVFVGIAIAAAVAFVAWYAVTSCLVPGVCASTH